MVTSQFRDFFSHSGKFGKFFCKIRLTGLVDQLPIALNFIGRIISPIVQHPDRSTQFPGEALWLGCRPIISSGEQRYPVTAMRNGAIESAINLRVKKEQAPGEDV
ncbi:MULTISPECIES: hypothetical protein [unclassified Pseudomonas]|uniref:hypothetical protein n=1 Tax=unclassified Pseudomonas TaxID=196821 RepID=UPI00235E7CAC|nr:MULTISPECIES: hypothetical protein [unclassified Pseudomonas]